jgi:hypothetical protein
MKEIIAMTRPVPKIIHPSRIILVRHRSFWKNLFGLSEVIVRGYGDINQEIGEEQISDFLISNNLIKI